MRLVEYPKGSEKHATISNTPKSVVCTDFHMLLLHKNSVRAMCMLNEEIIFEETYDEVFSSKKIS